MKSGNHKEEMRNSIVSALLELVEVIPYSDIEIRQICEHAFISRQTFYRYFQSKDSIVRWKTKEYFNEGICQIGRKYDWYDGYLITLRGLYELKALYIDEQTPAFVSSLIEFCGEIQKEALIATLTRYKGVVLTEKLKFQIDALDAGQAYSTRQWNLNGMNVEPSVMADYMVSIVPYDIYHVLNVPSMS